MILQRAAAGGKPPKYAAIKRIALGFPGTQEIVDRHGHWFNVGSKTFALNGMPNGRWIFKLPQHQQMMLFDARPQTFTPMRAGRLVWSYVQVENLDAAELKDLLTAAWRMVATKKLQAQYGQPSTSPKQTR
ncbi:MAG TPA: MmcQ/YjbR family DNA-binding protein [Rhizomicrobium sp.]